METVWVRTAVRMSQKIKGCRYKPLGKACPCLQAKACPSPFPSLQPEAHSQALAPQLLSFFKGWGRGNGKGRHKRNIYSRLMSIL